jgi:molybdate transport system permease protein
MAGNADNAFEAIVTSDAVIVYVPQAWSSIDHAAFQTMLQTLDAKAVSGATTLKSLTLPYVYTSQTTYTHGSYTYNFGTEVEPGYYYAIIRDASGNAAPASVAQFAEAGTIADASNVNVTAAPTGIAAIGSFFSSVDMRPFWVSMRTSLVAMIIIFILGLLAARFSLRMNSRLKGVLDSLFTIPMVLPPTVCGFLLLVIFGNSSPIGRWLVAHGIALVFTWPAAVIAATVVGFPLMYRTCRGAFEAQDTGLFDAARTLGWSEPHIFFKLMLPLAWPSIAAGTVLAFARAMGEFGATLFFAGNYAGVTQTMPIAIYYAWIGGDTNTAVFWVVVTILISFIVILLINWYAGRSQKYRRYSSADGKHGFTAKAKEAGDVTDDSGYTDAIGKSPLVALTFDGTVGDKQ